MKRMNYLLLCIMLLPVNASAWQWVDLWQTREQQASKLLQSGVTHYRAGHYAQAFKQFSANKTSDGQYNAGNAAAFMGNYQEAIAAYDKAIAMNSKNNDAITNREIIKKLLQQQQQQNHSRDNSKKKNEIDKQKQQQKNSSSNNNQQQLTHNTKQKQSDKSPKENNNSHSTASSKQQRQDENNKQLLRRLSDDSGGLLQRKFLRDYLRRHGAGPD